MNILTEKFQNTVLIDGAEIPINTDFRTSIEFEMLMQSDIPDSEKIKKALKLYYPKIPQNVGEAVEKIIEFYSGKSEKSDSKAKSSGKISRPVYSFKYDADYIYSAFMQVYGIDLQTEKIHWHKFRALFKSLPENCEIMKIMGYRATEIPNDMPKKQKEFYNKMKKLYALPLSEKQQKRQNDLEDALMNSGDVSEIINRI